MNEGLAFRCVVSWRCGDHVRMQGESIVIRPRHGHGVFPSRAPHRSALGAAAEAIGDRRFRRSSIRDHAAIAPCRRAGGGTLELRSGPPGRSQQANDLMMLDTPSGKRAEQSDAWAIQDARSDDHTRAEIGACTPGRLEGFRRAGGAILMGVRRPASVGCRASRSRAKERR